MFAERLKKAMSLRGLSQAELARKTGIGKSSISNYINGEYRAKYEKALIFAKVLDVDVDWLMGQEGKLNNFDTDNAKVKDNENNYIPKSFDSIDDLLRYTFSRKEIREILDFDFTKLSKDEVSDFNTKLLEYARFLLSSKK